MSQIRKIRYHISKSSYVAPPLTWIQHRGLGANDVFVASYPRSGSTWLRFMLFELLTGQESSFEAVDRTVAGVGRHYNAPGLLPNQGRLLQTHEPHRREYKKAIYLVRDVRDVILSEYRFCRRLRFFNGDFDTFFERFIAGRVNRYGFWGDHVRAWNQVKQNGLADVLWIRFEDMRANTPQILTQIVHFLGIPSDTDAVMKATQNHSLQNMKQKEDSSKKFSDNAHGIRLVTDGSVGKWHQNLSAQQLEHLQAKVGDLLQQLGY